MDIPHELKPIFTTETRLPNGTTIAIPTARPVFSLWRGVPINFDYGGKPVLDFQGEACFAEIVVLRMLLRDGWDGVWVETYGGTHYLQTMPNAWKLKNEHVSLAVDKEDLLQKIWNAAKTSTCFDVFAWKDERVLFCEAKHAGKDKLTNAQLRFLEGALACGIKIDSLLIVEWSEKQ